MTNHKKRSFRHYFMWMCGVSAVVMVVVAVVVTAIILADNAMFIFHKENVISFEDRFRSIHRL